MANYNSKTEHAWSTFSRDLKGDSIGSLIMLCGREQLLVKRAAEFLASKYIEPATKQMDYTVIEEDAARSVDGIIEAAGTVSMLSPRRLVLVRDYPSLSKPPKSMGEDDEARLIKSLENIPEGVILIFVCQNPDKNRKMYKAIKKHGRIYDFDSMDRQALLNFAEGRFKSYGKEITHSLLNEFLDVTGYFLKESDSEYTLFNMENDIEKIAYLATGNKITKKDIYEVTVSSVNTGVFEMLDALSKGNKRDVYTLLNNILDSGGSVYSVLGLLISQFEIVLSARELSDRGMSLNAIAQETGINSFRLRKAEPLITRYGAPALRRILLKAYQVDELIKTGDMEQKLALEVFIAEL